METTTTTTPLAPVQTGTFERLAAEWRALWMVTKKEWLYMRRYPTWVIQMFIWPLIFPMGYILSARALAGPEGTGLVLFISRTGISDYLGYIVVGTTIWMWQNMVLWNVGFQLRNEQFRGTLETNWMTPTWRFAFLLGPSIMQLGLMMIFMSIAVLEYGLLLGVRLNGSPLLVLLVLLFSIPSVYGLGMAFASLVIAVKEAQNFVFLVRGLVMVFCGVTFPVALLPGWMQSVATYLPQTYMMRAFRSAALANASLQDLMPDLIALVWFGVVLLAAGYLLFMRMERRSRQTGAIGQY
jgi:ABC-2 type transport system permease protein